MASTSGQSHQQPPLDDLTQLVSSSNGTTVHPTPDALLNALQSRFRSDQPFTRLGQTGLVVVNPWKMLGSYNEASKTEYRKKGWDDYTASASNFTNNGKLEPHIYEMATRVYTVLRRTKENQVVIARGMSGSGKSTSLSLFLSQLLSLSGSSPSKPLSRMAIQVEAMQTILTSFGHAKTLQNPNASRMSRYLELHISSSTGKLSGAKVLTFGLEKSRVTAPRIGQEERTFHAFYQFLAGATTKERDELGLEDVSDYSLLSSSGTYRLPSVPFVDADDSVGMSELRIAMKTLGFKQKNISSIFSLLFAILVLGNVEFADPDAQDVAAYVVNQSVLEHAARLLGVPKEDLEGALTNKSVYVRKEMYTVLLNKEGSEAQKQSLMRDLYAILVAFVVETVNHKLAPNEEEIGAAGTNQVVILDTPGFQSRTPASSHMSLLGGTSMFGSNGFDEFCFNYVDEMVQSWVSSHTFDDSAGWNGKLQADGVGESLPSVSAVDNSACIELLRGAKLSTNHNRRKMGGLLGTLESACFAFKSGKDNNNDQRNEDLLQDLVQRYGVHASFVVSPSQTAGRPSTSSFNDPRPMSPASHSSANARSLFGINHYSGQCTYSISQFIEHDTDILDAAFVNLLRTSEVPLVAKLVRGPSLAVERHGKDGNVVVQSQVSARPLRTPTPLGGELPENLDPTKVYPVTTQLDYVISSLLANFSEAAERSPAWTIYCVKPNDSGMANSFDKRRVKAQIQSLFLPDIAVRKHIDFPLSFEKEEFCEKYAGRMQGTFEQRMEQCVRANGWQEGSDFVVGNERVWLSYGAWKPVDDISRDVETQAREALGFTEDPEDTEEGWRDEDDATTDFDHQGGSARTYDNSQDNLAAGASNYGMGGLSTPRNPYDSNKTAWASNDTKGGYPTDSNPPSPSPSVKNEMMVKDASNAVELEIPTSRTRRIWLWVVWGLTFYIPNFLLSKLGRMKRPDIRLAWREKLTIFLLIFLLNGIIVFYIVAFGKLLCPEYDKAWSMNELATHQGENDYYVGIQGVVYDVTDYVKADHSDTAVSSNNDADLEALAGKDMTGYFPVPLRLGCVDLVTDGSKALQIKNSTTQNVPNANHASGNQARDTGSKLHDQDWYTARFKPTIKQFYKGPLVWDPKEIKSQAEDDDIKKYWALSNEKLYDLTDYFYTIDTFPTDATYQFLDTGVASLFQAQSGKDITKPLQSVLSRLDPTTRAQNEACLENVFYAGRTDFRLTARCSANEYVMLVISAILMASMGIKFLAALQFGGKKNPELQDKFVICQVPCYTEGEDSLRRTIDSLAALEYDDKRKLILIICDGNIIGSGNDRTTPRIVLDILGVDPSLDPEPLLFKSVGEGSKALNYAKVYSGLYEFEGHVVPYMVIVKVGKPTERSKPGNRGKRDSQILVMHYLNRVHFDAPMSPLELEIYHQMRNVIGIDPAFYEYLFTVDADTTVTKEALNRLIASCADDSKVIGICGETKLENEEGSWWTMIQVYEYYIAHHLSKAFESLFGSVTCLPGCFTLFRLRTADKGRPILISNRVIDDYSEPNVDTLHKKNLFSLGEDRYLTTLILKHFPTFKTKFNPVAIAHTMAPDSTRVLFSQRRRWINSTIHNLCELVFLPELIGFCCFSMRFFVFVDLIGTLILPATVVYLVYLIVTVATGNASLPIISIIMLAAVYGLQALIFILKREFMLIGWMVVYILSYPVYSFFLPIYSFWCMDEFGWGNTRLIIGEGKDKKVLMNEDEKFDESMIPLKKFSEYEAEAWERGSLQSFKQSPSQQDTGDYYRNTNPMDTSSSRRGPFAGSPAGSRRGSDAGRNPFNGGSEYAGSVYGGRGGPGSVHNNGQGGMMMPPMMPPMMPMNTGSFYGGMGGMPTMNTGGSMYGFGQNMTGNGSVYGGMDAGAPRNTMMTMGTVNPFMPPQAPFAGSAGPGSVSGAFGASRMSTFSMAGPSMSKDPSDEEIIGALREYLGTQDLMTVTKKSAREAMAKQFPQADLTGKKDFLNKSIDAILSQA